MPDQNTPTLTRVTRAEAAQRLGVHPNTVRRYEVQGHLKRLSRRPGVVAVEYDAADVARLQTDGLPV